MGRKGPKGRGRKVEGEGVDIPGPTFSLVYATPLLQQQVQLIGLNPALKLTHTHTHTRLTALYPGLPG